MPPDRSAWLGRIKAVEREHSAVRLAVDRLLSELSPEPTILPRDIALRDVKHSSENLESTYIVRLFTEFETGLRLFWLAARNTDPPARVRDLLESISATRRIPHDQLANVHLVREYRNILVHERDEEVDPIPIAVARGHLCRFFAFLPLKW